MPGLEDLAEVGRLQFQGQFKAGMDESHRDFVVDNDTRETFEMWEACRAEGVRDRQVDEEVPSKIQELHEESLKAGRSVLEDAEPGEKEKWLSKDGEDWSGAFGHDPKAYVDSKGRRRAEPGKDKPIHDPINPSSDDDSDDDGDSDSDSDSAGGAQKPNGAALQAHAPSPRSSGGPADGSSAPGDHDGQSADGKKGVNAINKRSEKRKHRGLMQWKPVRNVQFTKDEAKFGIRRLAKKMTGLEGREPDVETETGT